MAATVEQWNTFNNITKGFYENPEGVDYMAFAGLVRDMRAVGTKLRNLNVTLQPDSAMGRRLAIAYAAAQAAHEGLPGLNWQGRKDPYGVSGREKWLQRYRNASPEDKRRLMGVH